MSSSGALRKSWATIEELLHLTLLLPRPLQTCDTSVTRSPWGVPALLFGEHNTVRNPCLPAVLSGMHGQSTMTGRLRRAAHCTKGIRA